jgi:hypothetical protein
MENYMQKNGETSSLPQQRAEMTFVELLGLFIRKRRLFLVLFAVLAILLAGGGSLRTILSQRKQPDGLVVTAKAIVADPYFDRAGEFSSGLAVTDAASELVGKELGADAVAAYRKNVTATYDSSTKTLSIAVKGHDEMETRKLVLAGMAATRELMRKYGSERFDGIARRIESVAVTMITPQDSSFFKDGATPYFEGYAQALATRIEIESLLGNDKESNIDSSYPYNLLVSDLGTARSNETAIKGRFETYVKESGISMSKAVAEVMNRSAEILNSKIALLREVQPAILVIFDIVDVNVKVNKVASVSVGKELMIGLVASLFLAIVGILIAGYADRIKADPEAMLLLHESRAHPSRRKKS